jgi:ribosomal protein S18 acetylase RimI-like enzyme
MPEIAGHEPMGTDTLATYVDDGRAWVTESDGAVVGYTVVDFIDDAAHIEQISVAPDYQGRGLARALIDEVDAWARARGLSGLTLTTFSEVPWNRPLYEHLGFEVVAEAELSLAMVSLRAEEATYGLDPEIRVAMRRPLAPPG